MISNELFQAAVVAALKADTALTAYLAAQDASNEIREDQWQGRNFAYPAVRVGLDTQIPEGEVCYTEHSEITFSVLCFSEQDSSKQAAVLAGLVEDALLDQHLTGTGFATLRVLSDGMIAPIREALRVWRSEVLFRVRINQG